jgi:TPR repeat protein
VKQNTESADRWRNLALDNVTTRRDALVALADLSLADGDSSAALTYLEQTDASDPVVAYKLSRVLATLDGSSAKSVSLLVAAANGGNPSAMLKLAQMGLVPEEAGGKSAAEWLQLAEAAGSTEALVIDASTATDAGRAHQLLDDAIAINSCDAKSVLRLSAGLTDLNYRTEIVPSLVERARGLKPADPDTLYLLAEQSLALSKQTTSTEAFDLLSRAADAGYLPAMREVATYYRDGLFTEKNVPHAARLLFTSALAGNKGSLTSLLALVASAGPAEAKLRDLLTESLDDGTIDRATEVVPLVLKAAASVDASFAGGDVAWLRDRATGGSSKAMLKLADTLSASSLPSASEESARWLHAAALSGDQEAFAKYALVLQLGIGVSKDPQQADYWLRKAQGSLSLPSSSGG